MLWNRFRHHVVGTVVACWIIVLVLSIVARLSAWQRLDNSVNAAITARDLGQSLDHLFSSVLDAETSQRGFVITGNPAYLEPYRAALMGMAQEYNRLATMAQQDKALAQDLLTLRGLTELRSSEMADVIKIRQEKNSSAAITAINTGHSRETLDHIRTLVSGIRQRRVLSFASSDYAIHENMNLGRTLTLLGGCLALAAGIAALYLVRAGYFQDKARQELSSQKRQAEKALLDKVAFLADMSHEIRTPMNAILGFSELLEEAPTTPQQAHYIRAIRQSGVSLLHVINDILDLSKIESGKLELNLEPTALGEICEFLQIMFAQQAAQKKLRLMFDSGQVPSALVLDRLRIRQVLVNLVNNSIKYTREGHVSITMQWQVNEDDSSLGTLTIAVEDSGVGIPAERQQEVFKPFVQSGNHEFLEQQGTGLGLSIVKRLVEAMGGSIALESATERGSTFRLTLPNVAVSARLPVSDTSEGTSGAVNFNDFTPAKILIVDDHPANRDFLAHVFGQTAHHLKFANDGEEALQNIRREKPDLVLLDVRMPKMDGPSALDALRKERGFELMPVIALTASELTPKVSGHFSGYLRKPFSRQELYTELAHFLPRVRSESVATPVPVKQKPAVATARQASIPWNDLTGELNALYRGDWPSVHGSLAVNETRAFARKLRQLAENSQCEALSIYADSLDTNAETFAVREMENQLSDFPALIERIKKSRA